MQDYDEIVAKVTTVLAAAMPPDGPTVTKDLNLVDDLGLDSMKVLEILEALEDSFDISIPMNVMPEVRTPSDLATEIQKILGKK
ncbi:MAG: acyl carrier protein [Desulfopila sp.]